MEFPPLYLYNTLTRKKEAFTPIRPPYVGMYVCGPTVYGEPHLGHARSAVVFDVLYRFLNARGYKVRYVRNITDVGHLEGDADEGEDKILKRARLEKVEPIEIAQYYTHRYHKAMDALGVLRPSIEPTATGHIVQQITMIEKILQRGYAYVVNGSVYLDVEKYSKDFPYGILSGRRREELLSGTRQLEGQGEKRNPQDFALWKKAPPTHLMQWDSPWGRGYPGWHIECSAMSTHYLGVPFDIHGGGMDLIFPHHEAEIAQSHACYGDEAHHQARFWVHNNLVTLGGQKMSKSLGNFITLEEIFTGRHEKLSRAYHPMAVRMLILQAHYRSTLDFSDTALLAAQKAYQRLMYAYRLFEEIEPSGVSSFRVEAFIEEIEAALADDLNTAVALAHLFQLADKLHALRARKEKLTGEDLMRFREIFGLYAVRVLGLEPIRQVGIEEYEGLVRLVLQVRSKARMEKNYGLSDFLRQELGQLGISVYDTPAGTFWAREV
ncbi:MAG: cysteine--tRNA ligase [Bacteroidia bacterium]